MNLILQQKENEEKELRRKLAKNMKYSNYLTSVVEYVQRSSDGFSEVQDILNRYYTLQEATRYLTVEQQKNISENENRRANYLQFINDKSNCILNHNNEIASLQKDLETFNLKTHEAQALVEAGLKTMSDKTSELGQLLSSIGNILEQFDDGAKRWKAKSEVKLSGTQKNALTSETITPKNIKITESRGQKAIDHLERIAEYIIDYSEIVTSYRSMKQSNT